MLKIGHRGACGYELENTLASFQKALDLKVDVIELDVRICKSGELLVIHDKSLDRTCKTKGLVKNKTLTELKKIKLNNEQTILTLFEVLDLIDKKCKVNIELKDNGIEDQVIDLIENLIQYNNWTYESFIISSFNHYQVQYIGQQNKQIRIGALLEGLPVNFKACFSSLNLYSVHLCHEFINSNFIAQAHECGVKVFVWTVNELEDIEQMQTLGVDGIISNYPDRIQSL